MNAIEAMGHEIAKLRARQEDIIDDSGNVPSYRRYEYQELERSIQVYRRSIGELKAIKEGRINE